MTQHPIDPLAVCIDAIYGIEKPPASAFINETACIGCTLCIQACPVDAIIGAAKQMHTIVAAWCTGCELCVPPCPVDCISMLPLPERLEAPRLTADRARRRYQRHLLRNAREQREKAERLAARTATRQPRQPLGSAQAAPAEAVPASPPAAATETRQVLIAAAVARARQINAR